MILAVHISDAVLRPEWLGVGWLLTILIASIGMWKLHPEELPRLAMVTAVFFTASSVHIPVGIGRVHLLLTGLVGILAGTRAGLVVLAGLTLQNRLIGHGGLLTIGVNSAAMGIPAVLIGLFIPARISNWKMHPTRAGVVGAIVGAFGVASTVGLGYLVLLFGSQPEWQSVTWTYVIAHIPVMFVEALLTGVLLSYFHKVGYSLTNDKGVTSSSGTSH